MAEQAGLSLTCSQTPKTGFLVTRLISFHFRGLVGVILTAVTVLWCSISASKLFVSALEMDHQQLLVAYPCALVYGVFALLTVF